ncbi:hypothetical protein GMOD_00004945 [Pyrenophora seminiperda CCB06]|uniref:Uncharacterized protein n=1 Tax=Pyrenophora seminiperda CCB06 TaxID=1302712 RepID=A0A3M7MHX4_9PLEO|nr:hypothetical protein GMOD_00004945 [Pyrenophora seminiperda CCB06]
MKFVTSFGVFTALAVTCSAVDVCCDHWAMKDPSTGRYTYCAVIQTIMVAVVTTDILVSGLGVRI